MDKKTIKAKILRALGITKPIPLDKYEIQWIKLCKGHYTKKYPHNGNEWTDVLKPMFNEIYGWTAEDHYADYLNCIFGKLLSIHFKIRDDYSYKNQLGSIFSAAFYKSPSRQQELPIERAISDLCGLIQCSEVVKDGVNRYYL